MEKSLCREESLKQLEGRLLDIEKKLDQAKHKSESKLNPICAPPEGDEDTPNLSSDFSDFHEPNSSELPSSSNTMPMTPFMLPPEVLQAMQSNLPPQQIREVLNRQADLLEQQVSSLSQKSKNAEIVQEIEELKASMSKIQSLEEESRRFQESIAREPKLLDLQKQLSSLKAELSECETSEQKTYEALQRALFQVKKLENELSEKKRTHEEELNYLDYENEQLRSNLQKAQEKLTGLRLEKFEVSSKTSTRFYSEEPAQESHEKRSKLNSSSESEKPESGKSYTPVRTIVNFSSNMTEILNWRDS